jgi:hypothetical protein
MSEADQFRQYAEEAMLWVSQSKTKEEKQILVELLCTWTAAAVASERDCCSSHNAQTARSHRRRFSGWRVKFCGQPRWWITPASLSLAARRRGGQQMTPEY